MKAIVAMTPERLIGVNGALPWHLPGDLKFFKQTTLGHRVVMGRKTYDSIGKPLPKRDNIVLTRDKNFYPNAEVTLLHSVAELLRMDKEATDEKECFVIGGAQIYRLLLPYCSEIYVTEVKGKFEGDTYLEVFESDFPKVQILSDTPDYRILLRSRKN
ncbi:MAG: dihydrofolate reductase [Chthoniobacterales bacterium]